MGKKHKEKEELTGGWASIHAAVWLLGLAIIAWQGWWWPGILVLVAISVLFEAFVKSVSPESVKTVARDVKETIFEPPTPMSGGEPSDNPVHHMELLPGNCPKCGAPTRGHEIHWTGPRSADCPFCGSNLPMKSA
jgi:hypothetical protein